MIHHEPKFRFLSSKNLSIDRFSWVEIKQVSTAYHLAHHNQLQTEYKQTQLHTKYKFILNCILIEEFYMIQIFCWIVTYTLSYKLLFM